MKKFGTSTYYLFEALASPRVIILSLGSSYYIRIASFIVLLLLMIGCSPPPPSMIRVNKIPSTEIIVEEYTISYGDDRFHDCKDLVDISYGVTVMGDTLELSTTQRACPYSNRKKTKGPNL